MHTYTAKTTVSSQMIADQIVTAIEGGIGYWCENWSIKTPTTTAQFERPAYSDPKLYEGDFKLVFKPYEDEPKELTPETIQKGLDFMAEKYPDHFGDMMAENGDASTADVFLQACLFQEIVYG
jgi:hypothetical protein